MNFQHLNINIKPSTRPWDNLFQLVQNNRIPGIQLSVSYFNAVPHWTISEVLPVFPSDSNMAQTESALQFILHRNQATAQRITESDSLGLVGFSSLNLKDTRVYLTEGVSDFLTMKLLHPNMNVLGLTTLSGSVKAKKVLCSLFDSFCIISDNDNSATHHAEVSVNTGVSNAIRLRKFLLSHGKQVKIKLPSTGFKDITEEFLFEVLSSVI